MSNEGNLSGSTSPSLKAGYMKPPKKYQWSKGQSGNPAGKTKGPPSLQEMIKSAASKTVKVKLVDGETKSMPLGEALMETMLVKAAKGDYATIKQLIKWSEKFLPAPPFEPLPPRGRYVYIEITPEEIQGYKAIGALPADGPDHAREYRVADLQRAFDAQWGRHKRVR